MISKVSCHRKRFCKATIDFNNCLKDVILRISGIQLLRTVQNVLRSTRQHPTASSSVAASVVTNVANNVVSCAIK